MSAIADITVFDGASTPVSHTLKAVSVVRKNANEIVAEHRENLSSLPLIAQVRATTTLTKMKSGIFKVQTRTVVPVMESVSGQNAAGYTASPKVAYENTTIVVGLFHERSTEEERRTSRMIAINMGNNVTTSVAAATTGIIPELMDMLVAPT